MISKLRAWLSRSGWLISTNTKIESYRNSKSFGIFFFRIVLKSCHKNTHNVGWSNFHRQSNVFRTKNDLSKKKAAKHQPLRWSSRLNINYTCVDESLAKWRHISDAVLVAASAASAAAVSETTTFGWCFFVSVISMHNGDFGLNVWKLDENLHCR